ncbi:UDP-N-acetylmuramate--L-alanine ligase [Candidatus Parcubacteria bacterium]|nr:UDP-N-acetylmuramate--L-alanine ligase [Candidatus Parcubacteria bacterium]
MEESLTQAKRIHLIGIGGIGISALARLLHHEGRVISGTEDNESAATLDELRAQGVSISLDLDPKALPSADCYIYSDAWLTKHPAVLEEARSRGVPTLSYFEALGKATRGYYLFAVAGTHGKTTTTAMLTDILEEAKLDPTAVVGSLRVKTKSNFRPGGGKYFVVEADEYMRHFLYFSPQVLVITNIDRDHLDYYRDLEDIQSAFRELALKVPEDGFVVCDTANPHLFPVIEGLRATVVNYAEAGEIPQLKLPGKHNIANAKAALSAARTVGVKDDVVLPALASFEGTARRFEYKGETPAGAFVYDDYAHNPPKVRAALEGTREKYPDRRIVAVFQPHLYSRTRLLLPEFAESFGDANEVIVLPIYAAREQDDGSTSSEMLADELGKRGVKVSPLSFIEAEEYLKSTLGPSDLVLTLGAGEAHKVGEAILS